MCTRNILINVRKPEENKNYWRMPKYLINEWENDKTPKMYVKCGQCYECKHERARNWTYKIYLESLEHTEKCFITLTYRDNKGGRQQVEKRELQLFIKRLRKKIAPTRIKYFAAGEYGEKKGRAHYHIIIMGYQPKDIKKMRRKSKKGFTMYSSKEITNLWGKGITTIQPFNIENIGYITLYINNNAKIDDRINYKQITEKKLEIKKLKIKHGVYTKYEMGNEKTGYGKMIKNLTVEQLRKYKKDYNEKIPKIKMRLNNEFNTWSQGMGFETWIKKKYYKYPLILNGMKYEIPKEYLRKVLDNIEEYADNTELLQYVHKVSLERKKYAEENMIAWNIRAEVKRMRDKEKEQLAKNFNRKKLHKKEYEAIF